MKKYNLIIAITFILSGLTSCKKDKESNPGPQTGNKGVYVINEGAFNNSDASLSYYDKNAQTITNNIFNIANNYPLGDVAQSMFIHNGKT